MGEEAAMLLYVAHLSSKQNRGLSTDIAFPNSHFTPFRLYQPIETAQKRGFA
jgi:hypothetical protein